MVVVMANYSRRLLVVWWHTEIVNGHVMKKLNGDNIVGSLIERSTWLRTLYRKAQAKLTPKNTMNQKTECRRFLYVVVICFCFDLATRKN